MKKAISIILAVLLVVACFAGCGTNGSSGKQPSGNDSGGSSPDSSGKDNNSGDGTAASITDLRVALAAEPATLDLGTVALSSTNASVTSSVYATLFDYNSNTGEYGNYLASDHKWIDDLTLQITIRDDVYSQSGAHITADDVVFDFTRGQSNPTLATTYQWFEPGSFEKISDYVFQVKFTTKMPSGWQTFGLSTTGIYAKSDFESMSEEEWARKPIGTGPYTVDKWESGSEIVLKKHPDFWGEEPTFDSITFKFIPDANGRVLALQSKDIDYAENISASLTQTVEGVDGLKIFHNNIGQTQILWFNGVTNEITSNKTVRRALEYATNKEAILYTVYNGNGHVSDSIFTYGGPQYREPVEDRSYNPEKAKELLAEAGYADGFELSLMCYESSDYQNILTMLQSQWAEIGVICTINTMDKGAFFEQLYAGNFDCYTIHSLGLDPTTRLFNYRSTMTVEDGNFTGFSSESFDEALNNALVAETEAERDEYCKEAADYLREDCPFFSICDTYLTSAGNSTLDNIQNGPTSYIVYYKMTLAK